MQSLSLRYFIKLRIIPGALYLYVLGPWGFGEPVLESYPSFITSGRGKLKRVEPLPH